MRKVPFNCVGDPVITNSYRTDKNNPHYGTDYAMPRRTAILSMADGRVVAAKYWLPKEDPQTKRQWLANTESDPYKKKILGKIINRSLTANDYGNYIKIDHGNKVSTLYAHLDELIVYEGQNVKEGELIGYSDSTGNSTGDHLHFEIRKNDWVTNPDTFDYSFKGQMGEELKLMLLVVPVELTVTAKVGVNVRSTPSVSKRVVSILRMNTKFEAIAYCEGETIQGNNLWWKTKDNVFIWSGGTDITPKDLKGNSMKLAEHEAKRIELESKRSTLQAREDDLHAKYQELDKLDAELDEDLTAFKSEWELFAAEAVEEEPEPAVVEAAPVEEVREEVVEEPKAEPVENVVQFAIKEEWPIEVKISVQQINDLLKQNKEYLK